MCVYEHHRQIRATGMLHFDVRAVMCSDYTFSFRYNNLLSCSLQTRQMRGMENNCGHSLLFPFYFLSFPIINSPTLQILQLL